MIKQNAGEGYKECRSFIEFGIQNLDTEPSKIILPVSKIKHMNTIWPSNCTTEHLSQRNEYVYIQKNECYSA